MAFIAAAAPFLAAAGAGISAVGAISNGIATSNQANYQASIARNNAAIANASAAYAEQAGAVKAENQGRKGVAKLAGVKVAQASNGVDVNTGSALDVQTGERETNQLDTETVLNDSQLHAYGYRTKAADFQNEATLDEAKGENAKTSGFLSAAGSLLSNASSIGGKWGGSGTWGGTTPAQELADGVRPV